MAVLNTGYMQLALAADAGFRLRIKAALLAVAADVLAEAPATDKHGERVVYANRVIGNAEAEAVQVAGFLVMRPNVVGVQTSCAFQQASVVVLNAATDDDLKSQINTDWTWLAAAAAA